MDILLAVQLRTPSDPWLPRLKAFECWNTTEALIPFIPLLLSSKTIDIKAGFDEVTPAVAAASIISRLSTLCPNLEHITLYDLPSDPVTIEAVSEMLIACNRDTLESCFVDSPLTEEAQEAVYRLPRLSRLWSVIRGPTSLPTVVLPNLTTIDVEYDHDLNWLAGFRGATLEKLEAITFRSESEHIGDFLGAFESVALTTSAPNTLSKLEFCTSRSWNPNYSALLLFNQLKEVKIEFSCTGGCPSKVDDDVVMCLAKAMPKLEILQLGDAPCATPTGVTVKGLIGLAHLCPHLSELCIHFQAASLVEAAASAATLSPSNGKPIVLRKDCALTDLEVGEIPIPARSGSTVAHVLLLIFPHILNVRFTDQDWKTVAETVKYFSRIATFVYHTGKAHLSCLTIGGYTSPGNTTV